MLLRETDGDISAKLTPDHTLAKITICGDVTTGKVTGAQVEYGIYD